MREKKGSVDYWRCGVKLIIKDSDLGIIYIKLKQI